MRQIAHVGCTFRTKYRFIFLSASRTDITKRMRTEHSTDPSVHVNELTAAIRAQEQHDANDLREQLLLEGAGILPEEPSGKPTPQSVKQALLNGHAKPISENKSQRLHEIRINREGRKLALEELSRQLFEAKAVAFYAWLRQNEKRWTIAQRKRCQALLDLRAANRECAKFREEATAVSPGAVSLPCDRISGIFGLPVVEDPQYRFLKACVEAGIISAQEMGIWQ
jgi:hypothetical protein